MEDDFACMPPPSHCPPPIHHQKIMTTPIINFVNEYCSAAPPPVRLHMPGHKGIPLVGCEMRDITEIDGADELYHARGIIKESEDNAAALFGTYRTFYSCEGSSLCIRAMLHLALLDAKAAGRSPTVLAARNAHKVFLSAAALLDFPIVWLYPPDDDTHGVVSCRITPAQLETALSRLDTPPAAVYVTSPDYLGQLCDTSGLAAVCHRHNTVLLCDNAHGAYTHFLAHARHSMPRHPMDLGADLCCDSAHKTLPALTGAAYLHISRTASARAFFAEHAERALSLFASTSPSYLILQSLDAVNAYLADGYREKLAACVSAVRETREALLSAGYTLIGEEPLKLTIAPKTRGYMGTSLAEVLYDAGIVPEFYDPDYLVLMLTPENVLSDQNPLTYTADVLCALPKESPIRIHPPRPPRCRTVCTPREAMLSPAVTLPVRECVGRVLASPGVGCPPAVPVVLCGEEIDAQAVEAFRYYGVETCMVVSG